MCDFGLSRSIEDDEKAEQQLVRHLFKADREGEKVSCGGMNETNAFKSARREGDIFFIIIPLFNNISLL